MANTHFYTSAFFNGEFFFRSGAAQVFGNLGFFDIGGEEFSDERFRPFREKRERLKQDLISAYDGPAKPQIDEAIAEYRALPMPDHEMAQRLEAILQRMADEDEEEAILWLM